MKSQLSSRDFRKPATGSGLKRSIMLRLLVASDLGLKEPEVNS